MLTIRELFIITCVACMENTGFDHPEVCAKNATCLDSYIHICSMHQ